MKRLRLVVGLLLFAIPRFALAQNPQFAGTWKVNVAKSTYEPGAAPKNETLRFEPDNERRLDCHQQGQVNQDVIYEKQ